MSVRGANLTALLVVEDSPGDARLLREMFDQDDTKSTVMTHVETMKDAEKLLADHHFDIVLLDLGLPDAQGLEAVQRAVARRHIIEPTAAPLSPAGQKRRRRSADCRQRHPRFLEARRGKVRTGQ